MRRLPARKDASSRCAPTAHGRHALRATGQVVLFPGFLALYEEGRDDEADEESRRLPRLRDGDRPHMKSVSAEQHFTQPPPRYSEASLVKRLEELGIGRPSTYASILQTLKDREYVRVEKARFIPEESGRLVTAFLERFFERYVSYDYTAELEEELDDVSGGRLNWQKLLEEFWRDFRPKAGEVMEQKPSEVTAAIDEFLAPIRGLFVPGDPKVKILNIFSQGAWVAAETEGYGKLSNGREYQNRYAWIFEFKDDKIYALREYMDSAYVLQQLG